LNPFRVSVKIGPLGYLIWVMQPIYCDKIPDFVDELLIFQLL